MPYSHEFIERVKNEYMEQELICYAAEHNKYELGQYLVREINSQSIQDTETTERRRHLHKDWIVMMATKILSLDKII
jgi:hypothetical protein